MSVWMQSVSEVAYRPTFIQRSIFVSLKEIDICETLARVWRSELRKALLHNKFSYHYGNCVYSNKQCTKKRQVWAFLALLPHLLARTKTARLPQFLGMWIWLYQYQWRKMWIYKCLSLQILEVNFRIFCESMIYRLLSHCCLCVRVYHKPVFNVNSNHVAYDSYLCLFTFHTRFAFRYTIPPRMCESEFEREIVSVKPFCFRLCLDDVLFYITVGYSVLMLVGRDSSVIASITKQ